MGTPTEESWPGLTKLPDYVQFKTFLATPLSEIFTAAGPDLIELMSKLLSVDPTKRCKCTAALKLDYFSNRPPPTPGPMLPMPSSLSNDDDNSGTDMHVLPGSKRKLREGLETSGLAKKLVF